MASVRKTPPNVFIDSSVFFAAALSPSGPARELLQQGLRGLCRLLVSDLVLEETRRNLLSKAPDQVWLFDYLTQLPALRVVTKPSKAQVMRIAQIVEMKDAPIVAAALRGRADYLATHDVRHLLRQAERISAAFEITVLSPGDVLSVLRED